MPTYLSFEIFFFNFFLLKISFKAKSWQFCDIYFTEFEEYQKLLEEANEIIDSCVELVKLPRLSEQYNLTIIDGISLNNNLTTNSPSAFRYLPTVRYFLNFVIRVIRHLSVENQTLHIRQLQLFRHLRRFASPIIAFFLSNNKCPYGNQLNKWFFCL